MDFYALLGVEPSATVHAVTASYKQAVLKHHQAKIDSGTREEAQKHLEIAGRLKEIDDRIAHEQRLKAGGGAA